MAIVSTSTAATAIGVERKVLDNILAREAKELVGTGRRGKGRRLSVELVERLAVAMVLNRDLGMPVATALGVAEKLVQAPTNTITAGSLLSLSLDVGRLRSVLATALSDALEESPLPRRGRPRSTRNDVRGAP